MLTSSMLKCSFMFYYKVIWSFIKISYKTKMRSILKFSSIKGGIKGKQNENVSQVHSISHSLLIKNKPLIEKWARSQQTACQFTYIKSMKKISKSIKSRKDLAKPQWIYFKNIKQQLKRFKSVKEMEKERDFWPRESK